VTSIVFGFVLSTLFFYIQAAGTWAKTKRLKPLQTLWSITMLTRIHDLIENWLIATQKHIIISFYRFAPLYLLVKVCILVNFACVLYRLKYIYYVVNSVFLVKS